MKVISFAEDLTKTFIIFLIVLFGTAFFITIFKKSLPTNKYQVTFILEVKELDYTQENLREFIYHYLEKGEISTDNPLLEYGLLELGVDNISIKPIN